MNDQGCAITESSQFCYEFWNRIEFNQIGLLLARTESPDQGLLRAMPTYQDSYEFEWVLHECL